VWTFRRYVTNGGRDEVGDWFEGLSAKDQARFLTGRLELLRSTPKGQGIWCEPYYRDLPTYGLGEIRTPKYGGVSYRLLGFFGPSGNDFTIVSVCEKKAWKLPKQAFETANKRKKLILEQPELASEWNFEEEES